ncbi:ABC transporter ATP-binding protein [Saccharothrix mutabilis subsp. mutabilis]|uniref:ABC transporter ATP-binding protein n=1 Tax=Saccharothrix mutabilis subsp. mutabilis TaxID=66855 RepID=A0ABN0UDF6_9PSEU
MGVVLGLGLVEGVAEALLPWAIGRVLDAAVVGVGVVAAVGVLVGLVVVAVVGSVGRYALAARLRIRVACSLKLRVGLGATGGRVSAGDLATSVTTDTDDIGDYPNALARVVAAGVSLVVVAVYLLAGSPLLGVVVLVGVPVVMWVTTKVAEPLEDRQREHRGLLGRLGDLGSDIALGLRVLRGIGAERAFRDRYRDVSRRTRAAGVAVAHTQAALEAAKLLLPGVFLVVVTWLGARLAVGGAITAGELVAFFAAAAFLVEPLSSVAGFVSTRSEAVVAADNVVRALDVPQQVEGGRAPVGGDLVDGELVAPQGVFTAVVTGDAAGCAARLAGVVPGEATLGGAPLHELDARLLRRVVALHDDPALFSGTVREAVDPWLTSPDDAVAAALRTAVADDVVAALPEGLDTEVGADARTLSGGQRQRLALARAVLGNPEHLLLVDPTGALDTATEIEVARRLKEARRGRSTVVFTTSPAFLEVADRVVLLTDGTAVSGSHDTLVAANDAYRLLVTRGTA